MRAIREVQQSNSILKAEVLECNALGCNEYAVVGVVPDKAHTLMGWITIAKWARATPEPNREKNESMDFCAKIHAAQVMQKACELTREPLPAAGHTPKYDQR